MILEQYIYEWLNLVLRWFHLITGIAWIGSSFYFVWLDNSLREPPKWKKDKGIKGDLWSIHGGGFYEIAKYHNEPEKMPEVLHWFKWEAYSTWLSGIALLTVMFYVGAKTYLIDPNVADLSQWQAVVIGVAVLLISWLVYDDLCNSKLGNHGFLLAIVLLILVTLLTYFLTHTFSARGAYIHVGAVIGTIMVANVFQVIIPSQKRMVEAVSKGETPDPQLGIKAKLRSTHNNYLTLPVLFIMISNHYPMTYNHEYNWLVLIAIIVITAYARHYFNLKHRGIKKPAILVVSLLATLLLAWLIAPQTPAKSSAAPSEQVINDNEAVAIVHQRCLSCHAEVTTDDVFGFAQGGAKFDTIEQIKKWAPRIKARAINNKDMPLLNKTQMTDEERAKLLLWLEASTADENQN